MRPLLFALPLLAAASVFAQQQQFPVPNAKTHSFTDPAKTLASVCPVTVFARQQGSPQTLWTIALEDEKPSTFVIHPRHTPPAGYGVHVDLSQLTPDTETANHIRTLTVQVFYIATGTRAIPVSSPNQLFDNPHDRATLSKTFRLNTSSEAFIHLEANLLVGPASGITRVHLEKIDYADGHTWTAPSETACSTTPSLYVPVSN